MLFKIIHKTNKTFIQRQGSQFAAALSYSTLLSVVPMTVLLFYVSIQVDFLSDLFAQAEEQILSQLIPSSRDQIETYLLETTVNIESFSYISIIIVFLSMLWLSLGIERALNHTWHVQTPRKLMLRIPAHIILWVFLPMLISISITASTWLTTIPYLNDFTSQASFLSKSLPFLATTMALFLLYYFVPNTHSPFMSNVLAAVIAGLLFEMSKWLFALYITKYAMYEKLYGALSSLPVFMLWVFLSWVIILWGAALSYTLQKQGLLATNRVVRF
jgi:membrane protein